MKNRTLSSLTALTILLLGGGSAAAQHAPSIMDSTEAPPCRSAYNIERFGAVGDDRKDDADAIQAAVDAARQNHQGCIYIPTGRFRVGHAITIAGTGQGLKLEGDGQASRLIATTDSDVLRFPNGGNNLTIRDLFIGYAGQATPSQGAGIHTLRNTSNFLFDHIYIDGTAYGVRMEQPEKVSGGTSVITNSRIHGVQIGMYTNAGGNITNTHIIGGTYGYVADGAGTRMVAVALFGALSLVLDNTIGRRGGMDSFYGYDVEANYEPPRNAPFPSQGVGSALVIADNTEFHCSDCWMQDGTLIGTAQYVPKHVTITGGSFLSYPLSHYAGASRQITPHALEIAYAVRTDITGGDYGSTGGDGIHLGPGSGSNVVTGNHIGGRPAVGIFVGPTRGQNIQYNTIENWSRAAIATSGRMEGTSNLSGNVMGRAGP
ncbi:MAG: hypothetical protein JO060_05360 [Candidatus Eremiobacteraeota bacterium]|nr:hypothetical protein [Candidatus Eremiobacteraeota bacterium]MBV9646798.1 hypothetical protein [Candidatus Eremiobacteraeota bacterium]